ncbi:MAG TPA: phosphate ABC transporter permease PstA [Gaiellaceae bacterium]|nr:phosphate ABC transporter permease PstA [Gaiellaceae bacterium]
MSAQEVNPLLRPKDHLLRRRLTNRGMELLAWLAAALAVFFLGVIVWSVARQGLSQLSLSLFTKSQSVGFFGPTTEKLGLANAFVGSLVIVGIATAIALPFGILIAIYVNEFAGKTIRSAVTLVLDVLAGVPAIVIGIFVFQLIVVGRGQSGYAGGFALSILMLPLVARATMEVLALVPNSLREAALGVGAPRWRVTLGVILPQTIGGVLTGAVLAIARIAGETAPLLLVCSLVGGPAVNWNPAQALMTVPLAIFELSDQSDSQEHALAWAGALVLILFILVVSLTARWLATRSRRKIMRASG